MGIFALIVLIWGALILSTWDPERSDGQMVKFFFYILFVLFGLICNNYLVYVFARSKFATLETLMKKELIAPISDSYSLLSNEIFDLADMLGIEKYRITIWQFLSTNKYPSIEEDKVNRVHLLLPINFILLYKKNPEEFKAIICHELAHVVQKDTEIFQVCNTYYSIMRTLFVPNILFNIAITLYMLIKAVNSDEEVPDITYISSALSIFFGMLMIIFFDNGKKKVTEAREKSELLADMSSYIFNGDSIMKLLNENREIEHPGGYHPSPQKRFDNLNTIIASNNT